MGRNDWLESLWDNYTEGDMLDKKSNKHDIPLDKFLEFLAKINVLNKKQHALIWNRYASYGWSKVEYITKRS